jgi:DNA mismatch repair ATPase MutL
LTTSASCTSHSGRTRHSGTAIAVDPETAFLAAVHALSGGEDLTKALTCKGSTKFGQSLSKEEMPALLQERASCDLPKTRPQN